MGIYLFSIILFVVFSLVLFLLSKISIVNSKNVYLLPFMVIFGSVSMFRDASVGVDTELYTRLFSGTQGVLKFGTLMQSKYPLYELYSSLLYKFSSNPNIIIFANSFIVIIGITAIIRKLSPNTFVSAFLFVSFYFYFQSLNVSRQYIALVLLWIGISYLMKDKKLYFLSFYICAVLVHSTAIIGIVFYLLYEIDWNKFKYFVLALITLVLPLIMNSLLYIFVKVFPKYSFYLNTRSGSVSLASQGQGNKVYLTLFYALFLILGLFLQSKLKYNKKTKFAFYNAIMIIACTLGIVFSKDVIMSRIEFYFSILIIIYIPEVINELFKFLTANKENKNLYESISFVFIILISLVPMVYQLAGNISGVTPYSSFLN